MPRKNLYDIIKNADINLDALYNRVLTLFSEERIEKLQQSVNIVFELQPRRPQMGRSPYAASWFFYMLHGFCLLKKQNGWKVGNT